MTLARLVQNPQERSAPPPPSQQGSTPVTTARNEVQLPPPIPPLRFVFHCPGHSCAPSPATRVQHLAVGPQDDVGSGAESEAKNEAVGGIEGASGIVRVRRRSGERMSAIGASSAGTQGQGENRGR